MLYHTYTFDCMAQKTQEIMSLYKYEFVFSLFQRKLIFALA